MAMQAKRNSKKGNSPKTHDHDYTIALTGERKGKKIGLDGEVFRCPRCKPLPWRQPVAVKAAEGPRDWTPPGAGAA